MKRESFLKRGLLAASLSAALGLSVMPAPAAAQFNANADEILRAMSAHLGGLKAFSVSADISNEIITSEGAKLQFNSSSNLLIERPSKFHATRQGRFSDAVMNYDGTQLSLHGKLVNAYVQKDLKGSIDDAIRAIEQGTDLTMPGADLLLSDPYTALTSNAISSGYYGRAFVGGVETHHLGFRTPDVDWQIWIKAGDDPLPMKYVITTKWMTGAPQYSLQLNNWNTKPVITRTSFTFVPPEGAVSVEALPVDETGELIDKPETN